MYSVDRRPGGTQRLSREQIRDIADRVNIVDVVSSYVTLRKSGASFKGLCPFHEEKTPSFYAHPARQSFHCFGCGEGGDIYDFLQKIGNMSFWESLEEVARQAGVELPRDEVSPEEQQRADLRSSVYAANEIAADYFRRCLRGPEGAEAVSYLKGRDMTGEIAQRFGIGFAPNSWDALCNELRTRGISGDLAERAGLVRRRESGGFYDLFRNRVMIPIRNHRGKVVGFGGRILSNDEPKYLNTPESPVYDKSSTLFGLGEARAGIRKADQALIVEGYFDVISLANAGITNAVATCGTALTANQLRVLKRHTSSVVLVYDADEAGIRAACRSLDIFLEVGMWPMFVAVAEDMDPDDFVREQGAAAFEELVAHAEPLLERFISETIRRHRGKPLAAERVIEEVAPTLKRLAPVTAEPFWSELADRLRVDESLVRAHAGGIRGPRVPAPQRAPRQVVSPRGAYATEEWALLKHLIHHPMETAAVVDEQHIADMMQSAILAELVRSASRDALDGREPDVLSLLDRTDDPQVRKLLTDLSMSEELISSGDEVESLRDQLCLKIRRAHLKRLLDSARRRSRQARDLGEQQQAAAEVIRLSRELAAIQA